MSPMITNTCFHTTADCLNAQSVHAMVKDS